MVGVSTENSGTPAAASTNRGLLASASHRLAPLLQSPETENLMGGTGKILSLLVKVPIWAAKGGKIAASTSRSLWNVDYTVKKLGRQLGPDIVELSQFPVVPKMDPMVLITKVFSQHGLEYLDGLDTRLKERQQQLLAPHPAVDGANVLRRGSQHAANFGRRLKNGVLWELNWASLKATRVGKRLLKPGGWAERLGPKLRSSVVLPLLGQAQRICVGMPSLEIMIANSVGCISDRLDDVFRFNLTHKMAEREFANNHERYAAWQGAFAGSQWSNLLLTTGSDSRAHDQAIRERAVALCRRLFALFYPNKDYTNPAIRETLDLILNGLPVPHMRDIEIPGIGPWRGRTIAGGRMLKISSKTHELEAIVPACMRALELIRDNAFGSGWDCLLVHAATILRGEFQSSTQTQVLPRPAEPHRVILDDHGTVISRSTTAEGHGIRLGMTGHAVQERYTELGLVDELDLVSTLQPRPLFLDDKLFLIEENGELTPIDTLPQATEAHQVVFDYYGRVIAQSPLLGENGVRIGMDFESVIRRYEELDIEDELEISRTTVGCPPSVEDNVIVLGADGRVRRCSDLALCLGVRPGMTREDAERHFRENPIQELRKQDYAFDSSGKVFRCSLRARCYGIRPGMNKEEVVTAYEQRYNYIHDLGYDLGPSKKLDRSDPFRAHYSPEKRPPALFIRNPGRYLVNDGNGLRNHQVLVDRIQGEPVVIACSTRGQEMGIYPGMQLHEAQSCYTSCRRMNEEPLTLEVITYGTPDTENYFTGYLGLEDTLSSLIPTLIGDKANNWNTWIEGGLGFLGAWHIYGPLSIPFGRGAIWLWRQLLRGLAFVAKRIYKLPDPQAFCQRVAKNLISLIRSPAFLLALIDGADQIFKGVEKSMEQGHLTLEESQASSSTTPELLPQSRTVRPEAFLTDPLQVLIKGVYSAVKEPFEEMGNTWAMRATIKLSKICFKATRVVTAYSLKGIVHLIMPWLNRNIFRPQAIRLANAANPEATIFRDPDAVVALEKKLIKELLYQMAWAPSLTDGLHRAILSVMAEAKQLNVSFAELGKLADPDMDFAKLIQQGAYFAIRENFSIPPELRTEVHTQLRSREQAKAAQKLLAEASRTIPPLQSKDAAQIDAYLEGLAPLRRSLEYKLASLQSKHADLRRTPPHLGAYREQFSALSQGMCFLHSLTRSSKHNTASDTKLKKHLAAVKQSVSTLRNAVSDTRRAEEALYGTSLPSSRRRWNKLTQLLSLCQHIQSDHLRLNPTSKSSLDYDGLAELVLAVRDEISWMNAWTERENAANSQHEGERLPQENQLQALLEQLNFIYNNISTAPSLTAKQTHLGFLLSFLEEHPDLVSDADLAKIDADIDHLRKRMKGEFSTAFSAKAEESQQALQSSKKLETCLIQQNALEEAQKKLYEQERWRFTSKKLSPPTFQELWHLRKRDGDVYRLKELTTRRQIEADHWADEQVKEERLAKQVQNWDLAHILGRSGGELWTELLPIFHRTLGEGTSAEITHAVRTMDISIS